MTEKRRYRQRLRDRKAPKIRSGDVKIPPRGPDIHDRRLHRRIDPTPDEVFAERDRRMALNHHSLTAAYFSDPLPGYSALDQMTQDG